MGGSLPLTSFIRRAAWRATNIHYTAMVAAPVRPLAMHRRGLAPGKSLVLQQREQHRRCGGRRLPARPQPLAAIVVAVIGRTPQAAIAITRDQTAARLNLL